MNTEKASRDDVRDLRRIIENARRPTLRTEDQIVLWGLLLPAALACQILMYLVS